MRLATATATVCVFVAAAVFSAPALAHESHGLFGAHWHASDTLGFVAGIVAIAVALWWSSGSH